MSESALPSFDEMVSLQNNDQNSGDDKIPAPPMPGDTKDYSGALPSFDEMVKLQNQPKDNEKYGTPIQQAFSSLEGTAQGFLSKPVVTAGELALHKIGQFTGVSPIPGLNIEDLSPEAIKGREEANPWTHGVSEAAGFGAGMFGGTGEAQLVTKAGEIGSKLLGMGEATRLGSSVVGKFAKAYLEGAALQTGEEANKFLLGDQDPEHPVASALSNIGAAGLFSGGIGGTLGIVSPLIGRGLKAASETKAGNWLGQIITDFGSTWNNLEQNPNKVAAIYNELKDFFTSTSEEGRNIYGSTGLKAQAIAKLVPQEMTEAISNQNQTIATSLKSKIQEMVAEPESYPKKEVQKLMADSNKWMETVTDPKATPNDVFNASQELKQKLQYRSKFDKKVDPYSPTQNLINNTKELAYQLRTGLEDEGVWGDAGALQKGTNSAFYKFKPAQDDFLSNFTSHLKSEDNPFVDPDKIKTYTNQYGKTSEGISELDRKKPKALKNYVDSAEAYRDEINKLHARFGVDSPLQPAPLNAVKGTFGETTQGGKLATDLYTKGIQTATKLAVAGTAGAAIGMSTGLPLIGPLAGGASEYLINKLIPQLEPILGYPVKKWMVPIILKVAETGRFGALGEALQHAGNVVKGSSAIQQGVNALFTGSKIAGQQFVNENPDKAKKMIHDFVNKGGINKQIQNTLNQQNKQKSQPQEQQFAEGGEVKAKNVENVQSDESGKLSEIYPEHTSLMGTAKARVYNYLNSVKPQENQNKLPFDITHENKSHNKSYDRALTIADKPLSILKHIQNGTITPEHVKHMTQMWPEVHNQVTKEMIKKMTEFQMKGERPPYHVRQGLSMFMGQNLDSNMTPASIQAAQAVFLNKAAVQQAQNQPVTKNKQNTSKIGDSSKQYMTASQAAESRQTTARR